MGKRLRAVVIGAGLAGEGHTIALRYAGVEVVAICSRTQAVVAEVAARLGVAAASTDWRKTLEATRPDIVAVATPAVAHPEQIETALELGCHVFSDKPLAPSAAEAQRLYDLARQRGAKTALATTWMYDPGVAYVAELVADGVIGKPLKVESNLLTPWPHPVAVTWMNRFAEGGGLMNNRFPHQLAAVQRAVGGEVLQVAGEARVRRLRFPYVGHLHDYRQRRRLSQEEVADVPWEEVDGDDDCAVLVRLGEPGARLEETMTAYIHCSAVIRPREERTLTVYGEEGTVHYAGVPLFGSRPEEGDSVPVVLRSMLDQTEWMEERVPQRIFDSLPRIANDLQRDWAALALEFVADIRGEPHRPYPTFRQGWVIQQIVEAIRGGVGWVEVKPF